MQSFIHIYLLDDTDTTRLVMVRGSETFSSLFHRGLFKTVRRVSIKEIIHGGRRSKTPRRKISKHDPRIVWVEHAVVAGGHVWSSSGLIVDLASDLGAWRDVDFPGLNHGRGRLVDLLNHGGR